MANVTLIVDGVILQDDGKVIHNLEQKAMETQVAVGEILLVVQRNLTEVNKLMADVNEIILEKVAAVRSAVDDFVADVRSLLTQATPDISAALSALDSMQSAVADADAEVEAALATPPPPPPPPTP